MSTLDEFLDDLFASAAFAAFIDEAASVGGEPCPTATKYRAYAYYEEALADKNRKQQSAAQFPCDPPEIVIGIHYALT